MIRLATDVLLISLTATGHAFRRLATRQFGYRPAHQRLKVSIIREGMLQSCKQTVDAGLPIIKQLLTVTQFLNT